VLTSWSKLPITNTPIIFYSVHYFLPDVVRAVLGCKIITKSEQLLQTQKKHHTDARSNQERTKESDQACYCQIACSPFFALRWRSVIWFGIKCVVCLLFFLQGAFVPRSTIALNARVGEQQKHGGGSPWLRALCPFCVTPKRRARERERKKRGTNCEREETSFPATTESAAFD